MPRNPGLTARSLLEECTRIVELARTVARRPPQGRRFSELERVLEQVKAAGEGLQALVERRAPTPQVERSVLGIVDRLLGRQRPAEEPAREPEPPVETPLRGHSRTVSIPDLLSFLQLQKKTGVLRVVLPEEGIAIHFERGDLVGAFSSASPPDCRLGEILVEQGALARRELETFLVYHSPEKGRLGAQLELRELVSEEQLRAALTVQVQRLFLRLLGAREALFEFHEGESAELRGEPRLNVVRLLLESAQRDDEHRRATAPPAPLPAPAPESADLRKD